MATHLGIDGLLHIVGLLHRAAPQQAVGHRVVLIGQNRPVLHHVRVFFCFQEHPAVGDDHDGLDHVGVVLCRRIIGEKLHHIGVFFGQVLFWHQTVVGHEQNLLVLVLRRLLRRLQIRVFVRRADVDLAIDALFDALDHFVDRNILLNGHAHAIVDAGAVGVEQKVLRIDRNELHSHPILLHHANRGLARLSRDRLGRRFKHFLRFDDDFADAGAVNLGHQLDLVNRLANLVLFEVLHELRLEDSHIQRVAVHIPEVVGDVKVLTLTENRLHDLRMARLNGLLRRWSDDPRALRVPNLVLCGPLTPENALILQPGVEEVHIPVGAPAVAMVNDEGR